MRWIWFTVILIGLLWMVGRWISPISHPAGVIISDDPEQVVFVTPPPEIALREWTLQPLATFRMQARVLGTKSYGDFSSDISPYDLALGWGPMSDTSVLEKLHFDQSNRFYSWRYWGESPIPTDEITRHATNMHVVPADDRIKAKVSGLKEGSLVEMSGYLVECRHPKAMVPWRSSLIRTDKGAGACEILYMRTLQVLD